MDNKKNFNENESTVFSSPAPHNDKAENFKAKKIKVIISIVLVALLLIVSAYVVIKVIPDKETGTDVNKIVKITDCKKKNIDSVIVKTVEESFMFSKKDGALYLSDIESDKQDSSLVKNFIDALCSLKGITQEAAEDSLYGFDNPYFEAEVKGDKNFTVIIGKNSGDSRFLKISGDYNGTYVIENEMFDELNKKKLDFASLSSYKIAEYKTDVSEYKDNGGALKKFDFLTLSGKDYNEPIVFGLKENTTLNDAAPFIMLSPEKADAKNVDALINLFTNSLAVTGAYSFSATESDLMAYSLDNPDISVVLKVGNEEKWFKFSEMEDGSYAAISDDTDMIRKVAATSLTFAGYSINNFK